MTQTIEQLKARVRELEAEVERLKRTNSSYANLTKAQESQLTNLRQRLYQLKGADSAIDSERQANCDLTEQLAAEQLNNKRLRDALNQWIGIAANCSIESGWCCCGDSIENHSHPMACGHSPVDMADSVVREAIDSTGKALSLTASTEALDEYVAEKVREATLPVADELQKTRLQMITDFGQYQESHEQVATLTRQRDLAVEALKEIMEYAGIIEERCDSIATDKARAAIKESEGKR